MDMLERWLRVRALRLTLLLALGVVVLLSSGGVVSESFMPFGDSEHYVLRGMTLYGYLHTGQWAKFWDLFTLPKQSLAPLHYWIFFLVPRAWAGLTAYGIIQAVTTYGLMAMGSWALCRVLERPAWTAPLFLLCASQNISLDFTFFYFADVPFCALGMLALAWQVRAWKNASWGHSLISGLGASLLYLVKAPNALLFTATYLLAEIIRAILVRRKLAPKDEAAARAWRGNLARHLSGVAMGFVPMTLLILACGGFQSIVRLIDANEVSGLFVTNLTCDGLLRLFYFPLCLSFYYHVCLLLLIFIVVMIVTVRDIQVAKPKPPGVESATAFPSPLLWPLIVAYLVLGEFYSFGMASKEMRVLLVLLPVAWLAIFWMLEIWRVRVGVLFLAVVAYVTCAYSQMLFDTFGSKLVNPQDYQLEGDWLSRFPQHRYINPTSIRMTDALLNLVRQQTPDGSKIAVGSEQIFMTSESLAWALQHDQALQGREPQYHFENFLTYRGEYRRGPLLGARGILVIVHPSFQYSREVQAVSVALVKYAGQKWMDGGPVAQIVGLGKSEQEPLGYLIVLKEPMTDAQISELIAATNGAEFTQGTAVNMLNDERLSWKECEDVLVRWRQKRLGF